MDTTEAIQRQWALKSAQDDLSQDTTSPPDQTDVLDRAEKYAEFLLKKPKMS